MSDRVSTPHGIGRVVEPPRDDLVIVEFSGGVRRRYFLWETKPVSGSTNRFDLVENRDVVKPHLEERH